MRAAVPDRLQGFRSFGHYSRRLSIFTDGSSIAAVETHFSLHHSSGGGDGYVHGLLQLSCKTVSVSGTDLGKLFSFLLELGFRPSNRPGDVASLDSILYNVATHMEQFGILKTFKARR